MAKLYLIPTTLSNNKSELSIPAFQAAAIRHIKYFIVETPKTARMHLKNLHLNIPIQELNIQELNKHTGDITHLLSPILDKQEDVGLMSDCGLPAIADPGAKLVKLAHLNKIEIVPLIGPSSLMMALMSSGVNGQSFAFVGYLPIDAIERERRVLHLESLILKNNQSQIIIETPFRNQSLLTLLIKILNQNIRLSVTVNLMEENEQIISHKIHNWQQISQLPNLHKQEVVFVLGMDD